MLWAGGVRLGEGEWRLGDCVRVALLPLPLLTIVSFRPELDRLDGEDADVVLDIALVVVVLAVDGVVVVVVDDDGSLVSVAAVVDLFSE